MMSPDSLASQLDQVSILLHTIQQNWIACQNHSYKMQYCGTIEKKTSQPDAIIMAWQHFLHNHV